MMNTNKIKSTGELKKVIEEQKTEKTRIETKLDNLKSERDKLITELSELGIKEDEIIKLEDIIAKLEISIEDEITKTKKILEK